MSELTSLIWAVAGLVVASSLGIYLWRRPDASVRVRHKDSEVVIGPSKSEVPAPLHSEAVSPATNEPASLLAEPKQLPSGQDHDAESAMARAYSLLTAGNYTEGIKVLEAEAAKESDPAKRITLLAFGQHLAAGKGSRRALEDLRRTAQEHQGIFKVHLWFGVALRDIGHISEAMEAFERALTVATTHDDRATALLWMSATGASDSDKATVAADLLTRLDPIRENEPRSRVIARAAKLFLEAEPPQTEKAFSLYSLAITLSPADASLRFDLAYAYAEHGVHSQAFLQYSDLTRRDPQHDGGLNNLGVAASNLELESIAVDNYKKAEVLGNTLATANLAWKLINTGFVDEARTRLEGKVSDPDVHKNVLEALGGLAKRQTEDEDKKHSLLKKAAKIHDLSATIGRAIAASLTIPTEETGEFIDGSNTLLISEVSSSGVKGSLSTGGAVWDFEGNLVGTSSFIRWSTRKPEKESLFSSLFMSKGYGLLVWSEQGFRGFTYEGDQVSDPAVVRSFREWHFIRRLL